MDNAARIDDLWGDNCIPPIPAPHMEANKWLAPVVPTVRVSKKVTESVEFDVLGVKIVWTRDGARPFPQTLLDKLLQLESFADLPHNWDSYQAAPMSAEIAEVVIGLLLQSHQSCCLPHLVPLSDGGVGLRWASGNHCLEIDVLGSGMMEGLYENIATGDEVEAGPGKLDDVRPLIDRFFSAS